MAKINWSEMIYDPRYPIRGVFDELQYTTTASNPDEVRYLQQRCGELERRRDIERAKNKKLQETLDELLEEMREC